MELIRAIEKIKYGGKAIIITNSGEIIKIKVKEIPEEAIIWE
ncbi:MAG: hypothetical protein QXO12_00980 [Candidatus Pacearchaeota archaeon]